MNDDLLEPRKEPEEKIIYWAECSACDWEGENRNSQDDVEDICPNCGDEDLLHYRDHT